MIILVCFVPCTLIWNRESRFINQKSCETRLSSRSKICHNKYFMDTALCEWFHNIEYFLKSFPVHGTACVYETCMKHSICWTAEWSQHEILRNTLLCAARVIFKVESYQPHFLAWQIKSGWMEVTCSLFLLAASVTFLQVATAPACSWLELNGIYFNNKVEFLHIFLWIFYSSR